MEWLVSVHHQCRQSDIVQNCRRFCGLFRWPMGVRAWIQVLWLLDTDIAALHGRRTSFRFFVFNDFYCVDLSGDGGVLKKVLTKGDSVDSPQSGKFCGFFWNAAQHICFSDVPHVEKNKQVAPLSVIMWPVWWTATSRLIRLEFVDKLIRSWWALEKS